MYSPKSSLSRPSLQNEEKELVFKFVRFLNSKISAKDLSKEQISELRSKSPYCIFEIHLNFIVGAVLSIENVFHITKLEPADRNQVSSIIL